MGKLLRISGVSLGAPGTVPKRIEPTVCDSFQRADSTYLGRTEIGDLQWSKTTGAAGVAINGGRLSMNQATATGRVELPLGDTNGKRRICAQLATIGAPSQSAGGVLIAVEGGNYWWVSTRISGSEAGLAIYSFIGSTTTLVTSAPSHVPAAGDVITIDRNWASVRVYLNDDLAMAASLEGMSTTPVPQVVGFATNANGTSIRWQSFSVSPHPDDV